MKYKVGDKVRIKSKDWYEKNKDEDGDIRLSQRYFNEDMCMYCGKIATIEEISTYHGYIRYNIDIDKLHYFWDDEMFEEDFDFKQLKVGETFSIDGKTYRVYEKNGCVGCAFCREACRRDFNLPNCSSYFRNDKKDVIFTEIKKTMDSKEERNIKVDIVTARKWYNGDDESLKELALQVFSKEELEKDELPNSWKEFCEKNRERGNEYYIASDSQISCTSGGFIRDNVTDRNLVPNKAHAQGILALCQLIQLRDCYRQGWKPDWTDIDSTKYDIHFECDVIETEQYRYTGRFLSFQSKEIRDKFLENFRDLIEQAKEYI